jgi:hypothetical protein
MLEEVQVAPRLLLGVVNLAARTLTLRTRKTSALREVEDQLQPTLLSVELDADNAPRVPQAERLLEEIRIVQEKLRSSKGRARSSRRDPTIPTRFSDEPVKAAACEASPDARDLEQRPCAVASRPEQGAAGFHDVLKRVAAEEHRDVILFQTDGPEARRRLVAGERPGVLQRIHGAAFRRHRGCPRPLEGSDAYSCFCAVVPNAYSRCYLS